MMCGKGNILLNICVLAALMSVVIAQVDGQTLRDEPNSKRSDIHRLRVVSRAGDERSFGGPRFGRSGAATVHSGNNDADGRAPERFFVGSRYGKRSEMAGEPEAPFIPEESPEDKELLDCQFTGIGQLYHCEKKTSSLRTQKMINAQSFD